MGIRNQKIISVINYFCELKLKLNATMSTININITRKDMTNFSIELSLANSQMTTVNLSSTSIYVDSTQEILSLIQTTGRYIFSFVNNRFCVSVHLFLKMNLFHWTESSTLSYIFHHWCWICLQIFFALANGSTWTSIYVEHKIN